MGEAYNGSTGRISRYSGLWEQARRAGIIMGLFGAPCCFFYSICLRLILAVVASRKHEYYLTLQRVHPQVRQLQEQA